MAHGFFARQYHIIHIIQEALLNGVPAGSPHRVNDERHVEVAAAATEASSKSRLGLALGSLARLLGGVEPPPKKLKTKRTKRFI